MRADEHLIHDAQGGNKSAAEELFRRYQDNIYGFLLRMTKNQDLAADATQETFLRGYRGLTKYTEQQQFKSWLFCIARNEGLRCLKKQSRVPISGGDGATPELMRDSRPGPLEQYERIQMNETLEQALTSLTVEERQVVHLRIRENVTFKEIAEIMDCPINTAVGRMHTAKKKLKQLITMEA